MRNLLASFTPFSNWVSLVASAYIIIMKHSLYVLLKDGSPIYVGVTSNIKRRKYDHKKTKSFDSIRVIKEYKNKRDALIAENAIIHLNGLFDLGLINKNYILDEVERCFFNYSMINPLNTI